MVNERAEPGTSILWGGYWWASLLRGVIAIIFGVLAFTWPRVTLQTLVFLFGGYALVDGLFSLAAAIGGRRHRENRWLPALEGVVSVWAGVVTLRNPATAAFVLVYFISIWAMTTGFLRIVTAIHLRREVSREPWLVLSGALSVLFALMLMLRPALGVIGLAWVIAGFAIVMGVASIMLGIELHGLRSISRTTSSAARPSPA
jgi:uncharacterized membrane protein HdeD (DUF308 family)